MHCDGGLAVHVHGSCSCTVSCHLSLRRAKSKNVIYYILCVLKVNIYLSIVIDMRDLPRTTNHEPRRAHSKINHHAASSFYLTSITIIETMVECNGLVEVDLNEPLNPYGTAPEVRQAVFGVNAYDASAWKEHAKQESFLIFITIRWAPYHYRIIFRNITFIL